MTTTEKSKESGRTAKPGQTTVNGERGSHAHAEDGSQAETNLTAESVASLLKSDLAPAVEELAAEHLQTQSDDEDLTQTTAEGEEKAKGKRLKAEAEDDGEGKTAETQRSDPDGAKQRNAEAEAQVTQWQEIIGELETKIEDADEDEKAELQKELDAAKADLEQWEAVAKGDVAAGEDAGAPVPEALQQAITQWDEDGRGELPPELQELVDKKINKLTSRAKTAEGRVEELEAQVERLSVARGSVQSGPMMDTKQLDTIEANGEQMVDDLEAVIDAVATDEEKARVAKSIGVQSEHLDTPEGQRAAKRQLRGVQKYLQGIPAERERIQKFRSAEVQASGVARKVFPFLTDKAHADYQEAQTVLTTMPGIRYATPAWEMAIGTYVLGLKQLRKEHPELFKSAAAGDGRAPRKAPPRKAPSKSPASAGSAAAPQGARMRGRDAEEVSARAAHEKRPTAATVTRLLKSSLRRAL